MDTVIYTKSVPEYEMLARILADELPGATVKQGMMDGHYHLEQGNDVVVVSVDGAQGMELVWEYRKRFGGALVVWIMDDPYFVGGCDTDAYLRLYCTLRHRNAFPGICRKYKGRQSGCVAESSLW